MDFLPFLQTAGSAAGGSFGLAGSLIPFVLIIVIFYFFLIRPQNKKQKETEKMLNALKKGDKVITIGGIHGVVSSVKEKTVILKVDDNTKIEFNRSAISSVELSDAEKAKLAEAEEAKKAKRNSKSKKEDKSVTGESSENTEATKETAAEEKSEEKSDSAEENK